MGNGGQPPIHAAPAKVGPRQEDVVQQRPQKLQHAAATCAIAMRG